jgi:hypothetical protein
MLRSLDEIRISAEQRARTDALKRVGRAALMLEQELKVAVARMTRVSMGQSGSIGSIVSSAEEIDGVAVGRVGLSSAHDYLKYRLGGIKPAPGAVWPAYTKLPPVDRLKLWVIKAGLVKPDPKKKYQSLDARARSIAFAIALKRKREGAPPMQLNGAPLIETVINIHRERIKQILEGR